MRTQKIVVVGGGFAGVQVAAKLAHDPHFSITLISNSSHFRYVSSLYRAAKGGRRTGSSLRLDDIFEGTSVKVVHATATRVNPKIKTLSTADGAQFAYDDLVIAIGNITNYFGREAIRKHTFSIQNNDTTTLFKKHLHDRIVGGKAEVPVSIVGGGSIGVETAGALPAYVNHVRACHNVQQSKLKVSIIEPGLRLMPRRALTMSRIVTKRLQQLGTTIHTNKPIEGDTPASFRVGNTSLKGHTIVWAAGMTNPPFFKENHFKQTTNGAVCVNQFLEAKPHVYVLGDNTNLPNIGLARTALEHGTYVAQNFIRVANGHPRLIFKPRRPLLPVTLIPIGPKWVAVEWGRWTISGWLGAFFRLVLDLIAFKDVEAWPKAGQRWLEMGKDAEECELCNE